MNKFKSLCGLAIFCCAASFAGANTIITDPGPGLVSTVGTNSNQGFDFTVGSTPLLITALGLWDENQDGFGSGHVIGLWDNSGNLLAKAVIAPGTVDPLIGEFRYATVIPIGLGPIILAAGSTYVLGAAYIANDPDRVVVNDSGMQATFDPAVTAGNERDSAGSFSFPTNTFGFGSIVGPNALFSVPELGPGVFLIALVFGGLAFVHRRTS
jgi:hypothetical protein